MLYKQFSQRSLPYTSESYIRISWGDKQINYTCPDLTSRLGRFFLMWPRRCHSLSADLSDVILFQQIYLVSFFSADQSCSHYDLSDVILLQQIHQMSLYFSRYIRCHSLSADLSASVILCYVHLFSVLSTENVLFSFVLFCILYIYAEFVNYTQ